MSCPFAPSDCAWIKDSLDQNSDPKYTDELRPLLEQIYVDPAKATRMQVHMSKYVPTEGALFYRLVDVVIAALVANNTEISTKTLKVFEPLFSHELLKIERVPRLKTIPIEDPIVALVQNQDQENQFFTANIKVHVALLTTYGLEPEASLFEQLRIFATAYNDLQKARAEMEEKVEEQRREAEESVMLEAALTDVIGRSNVSTWSKPDKDKLKSEILTPLTSVTP